MTQPKLFSKPSLPAKASQELEIPPRLHPVVRDVVESLALRDVDCAAVFRDLYSWHDAMIPSRTLEDITLRIKPSATSF